MFCDTLNRSSFGDVFSILYDEENASSRHAHIFFIIINFFFINSLRYLSPQKTKKKKWFSTGNEIQSFRIVKIVFKKKIIVEKKASAG